MVSFTSRPSYAEGKDRSGHWIGGWAPPSPTAGLGAVEERTFRATVMNPISIPLPSIQ